MFQIHNLIILSFINRKEILLLLLLLLLFLHSTDEIEAKDEETDPVLHTTGGRAHP